MLSRYWQSYLLGVALITTGASAAMTAYYINQNTRSLIHRYYSQQRFIQRWLRDFNERWNFAGLPSRLGSAAMGEHGLGRGLEQEIIDHRLVD
jgi:hypothetical protein